MENIDPNKSIKEDLEYKRLIIYVPTNIKHADSNELDLERSFLKEHLEEIIQSYGFEMVKYIINQNEMINHQNMVKLLMK